MPVEEFTYEEAVAPENGAFSFEEAKGAETFSFAEAVAGPEAMNKADLFFETFKQHLAEEPKLPPFFENQFNIPVPPVDRVRAVAPYLPGSETIAEAVTGTLETVLPAVSSMTSPAMITAVAAMGSGGVAAKLAAGGFAGMGAKGMIEGTPEFIKAVKDGDVQGAFRHGTGLAMSGLMMMGAVGPKFNSVPRPEPRAVPPVLPPEPFKFAQEAIAKAAEVAPMTAKALEEAVAPVGTVETQADLQTQLANELVAEAVPAGPKEAPVTYAGFQQGFGKIPGKDIYTLTEDLPGTKFVKNDTVTANDLKAVGYEIPESARPPTVESAESSVGTEPVTGETVTPKTATAEVRAEIADVAKTEGMRPAKEVKAELVARLEKAIEEAPSNADVQAKHGTTISGTRFETKPDTSTEVTIEIPGDGTFTMRNTKENLTELLGRAKRIQTTSQAPVPNAFRKTRPTGDFPADVWVESSEPTHTVTVSAKVGGKIQDIERKARPIEVKGYEGKNLFLTSDGKEFTITEPKTGLHVGRGETISRAVKDAESRPKDKFDEIVAKNIAEIGERPPPKPIEPSKLAESEQARTSTQSDPFERARKGDESAYNDLDDQFREIHPEPEELEIGRPNPNQVFTPEAFTKKFNAAFAARDFDTILETIKATSDVSIWKPFLREQFKKQATDPIAAKKAEWMRHVFNGTRPPDAVPRPASKPGPTPRPAPPVTPNPRPKPGTAPPPKPPPSPPSPPPERIKVEPIAGGGAKSPFKIIEDFSAAIGKSIRVLRMKKDTLGVYRPGSTTTAEKFAGDLDTAAHELAGHWTDDKFGIGKPWIAPKTRSPYDSELAKFWIHGSVTPKSTLRYRRAEGIAEFIRAYVVNPKQAKLDAPTFAGYFEKTLPADALKAINDFGTDVRRWAGEDPLVRAGLNIRMSPPSIRERLWKAFRGRGFGFEINPVDQFRLWFDDAYHYAVKADQQIQDLRGGKRLPEDDFELLSRLLSTHDARMEDQFEFGLTPLRPKQVSGAKGELDVQRLTDPKTKEPMTMQWLLGAFDRTDKAKFNQDMRDTSAYMIAQRTIEKGAQLGRESNVSGIGAGIMSDKQAAQELLNRVAADPVREARLKESSRRYRVWADQNINMLVESGRLSKSDAKKIREDNQQYVDMHRLSEEFEIGNFQQRGGGLGTTRDVIKRFKGSTLELDNVYSNLLEQTDAIQKEANRNVVMQAFVDGLAPVRELHGPSLKDFDQFGRKVASQDRNTIQVFTDGTGQHWQFAPEIYESLKGLGELGTHAFIDLLAIPSRVARYLITHGPQFMTRNVVRDTFERSVTSRNASKPWDILQGYSQAELSRYKVFGGGQFGNYIVDRHVWNRELTKTMQELTKDPRNIFLSPLKLKDAWETLAQKSETLGRVAEFRRAFDRGKKELGYDDYNAALYAAGEARGLLDFAKAGTVMRIINKLVPFSNARIRGLSRAAFSAKENPATFAMRWGIFVLAPTIATMLWNRQDADSWEEYQQLPAYQKDFFWNFKVGPYWLRIPKPHELGVMAGGVERGIARIMGDKRAMEGWAGSAASASLPIGTPVEGTGPLKTMLELEFNRDAFRNRDIVPVWERDLKLELRKGTEHASGAGKGIAQALNVTGLTIDPRQVDYFLGTYGGLGQIATTATKEGRGVNDTVLKATGFTSDPAGSAARDVQWVIDWAKQNGKLSASEIKTMQELRKLVLDEKDAGLRDRKSADLRKYATKLRDFIETNGGLDPKMKTAAEVQQELEALRRQRLAR